MASDALAGPHPARLNRRPHATRLRRDTDVRTVLREGRAAHGRQLSVHVLPSDGPARWTVVAGRKVGGAVQRNTAKRRLRAVLQSTPVPDGHDVVVVARARMRALTYEELRAAVAEQVRRATYGCHAPAGAGRAAVDRDASRGGA